MAFTEEYYIHVEGEQKGPYTFPQLKRLYEINLIPEETLYWQDGMEQWQAVSELCGTSRRERDRRARQLRMTAGVVVAFTALVCAYCAPVLKEGWREMNEWDYTQEAAYWKARGFVREEVKKEDASVSFDGMTAASVTLTGGTAGVVVLPGTLYGRNGSAEKMTWKVAMRYNPARHEWRLPAGAPSGR